MIGIYIYIHVKKETIQIYKVAKSRKQKKRKKYAV